MNPIEAQGPALVLRPRALVEAINPGAPGSHALHGVIERLVPISASGKNGMDEWDDWLDSDEHADSDSDPEDGSHP